jgi:hypothetical protein
MSSHAVMPQFAQISTEAASSLLLLSSLLMYLKIIIIVTTPMAIKEQMAGLSSAGDVRWSEMVSILYNIAIVLVGCWRGWQ